jgi:hypothetical protein
VDSGAGASYAFTLPAHSQDTLRSFAQRIEGVYPNVVKPTMWVGAYIQQTVPGGIPTVTASGSCTVTTAINKAEVVCNPGKTYGCHMHGMVAQASAGTILSTSQCSTSPHVFAISDFPGRAWSWDITPGTFDFPWTCVADFTRSQATGYVVCDSPDPPI